MGTALAGDGFIKLAGRQLRQQEPVASVAPAIPSPLAPMVRGHTDKRILCMLLSTNKTNCDLDDCTTGDFSNFTSKSGTAATYPKRIRTAHVP
jgi:hypothetical protein